MQKILSLIFTLLLITACDTTQPPKAVLTRIEITPGTVLLTTSGQSKTLSARAFDQNNKPMDASFSWASSKPEQVSIDATGKIQANVATGSSSITASSGGVKSDAVTAAVVELADGAVLVADAQVVTDFV
jgi:Bacterial Ig-like domain (group 2)